MSTDYSKMSDFEVNKRVALVMGFRLYKDGSSNQKNHVALEEGRCGAFSIDWCNSPADAWPIITANKISIYAMSENDGRGRWGAEAFYPNESYHFNDNPLRAAMIVFLKMQESKNAS